MVFVNTMVDVRILIAVVVVLVVAVAVYTQKSRGDAVVLECGDDAVCFPGKCVNNVCVDAGLGALTAAAAKTAAALRAGVAAVSDELDKINAAYAAFANDALIQRGHADNPTWHSAKDGMLAGAVGALTVALVAARPTASDFLAEYDPKVFKLADSLAGYTLITSNTTILSYRDALNDAKAAAAALAAAVAAVSKAVANLMMVLPFFSNGLPNNMPELTKAHGDIIESAKRISLPSDSIAVPASEMYETTLVPGASTLDIVALAAAAAAAADTLTAHFTH